MVFSGMGRPVRLPPRKHLGQHFLADGRIAERMVSAAGSLDRATVIEIGPGQGALSFKIWQAHPLAYIGLEADHRCVAFLQETPFLKDRDPQDPKFRVLHQDALTCKLHTWEGEKIILSNLPYHISTPLLCQWLPYLSSFKKCILMFQREVAERLMAEPCTKAYGRLSVMTQAVAHIELLCHVKPGAFFPPPQVDSSVVILTPRPHPLIDSSDAWFMLEGLVKQAFSQRRKQLKNTLKDYDTSARLSEALQYLNLCPSQRAETVTVEQFVALCHGLSPRQSF